MKYILALFILIIILRGIRRAQSFSTREIPDRLGDAMSFNQEESFPDRPAEKGYELGLPGNLAGPGREPVTVSDTPGYRDSTEQLAGNCQSDHGNDFTAYRNQQGSDDEIEINDGNIYPRDVINGMIWSEILGPRGGIKSRKRF
ncbi:MAG: hypothetical protein PHD36_02180 [Desulfotomaculaceae bacterium]|nr:hypothetical protein [Desulfotomaculaceae bacterium]